MNKPQAEGKVNVCIFSRMQEKKFQHTSAIKKDAYMFVFFGIFKVRSKDIGLWNGIKYIKDICVV